MCGGFLMRMGMGMMGMGMGRSERGGGVRLFVCLLDGLVVCSKECVMYTR